MDSISFAQEVILGDAWLVIDANGNLKLASEGYTPQSGEVVLSVGDNAVTVAEDLVRELKISQAKDGALNNIDAENVINIVKQGDDPSQLEGSEPSSGDLSGSSLTATGAVDRDNAETIAQTTFNTEGFSGYLFTEEQESAITQFVTDANTILPPGSDADSDSQNDKIVIPTAVDDLLETLEDQNVTLDLLENDFIDPNDIEIIDISVPADQGTVHQSPDGSYYFKPAKDFNGEAEIEYTIKDGNGNEDSATAVVVVVPVNDAPTAVDDVISTPEDTAVVIDVLDNDTDIDGDKITLKDVSLVDPSQGSVEIVDGKVEFTPAENFNGEVKIIYVIEDEGGLESSAEVVVTVEPQNDGPIAVNDTASTDEDTAVTIDVLNNDTDIDGDKLTITAASVPADQGTVEIVDGKLVFTPAKDFNGDATISYTITDGNKESSAEVAVAVAPQNDGPVAVNDTASTDEDTSVTIDVLNNDTDIDGDDLTITAASVPADQGTVEIVDGKLVFTPAKDFNGDATISYTITDGNGEYANAEVAVAVTPQNDGPVAVNDTAATDEDTAVTIDVLNNDTDIDGDDLTITAASVPADQGTVEIVDGKLVFTPAKDFNGDATISYTITDGDKESSAEVAVAVAPQNDGPIAVNDTAATDEDTAVTIDVLNNDTDIDGDKLTITAASVPVDQGAVEIVDGKLVFTPATDFNGDATISYTITDG
ncbi:Ig-like domain-containing protein, partial [Vibrio superstes]|uniref:Ig-like domain-containing protein n=1 Tax=Vibrio superstes TaxID=198815 RepID=UPI000E5B7B46